ncbi:MAG: CoA transferase [Deltaproteobacteria bacterium]|nr:MAG: CoA transferase [Deltaproteobacteria bacterium]
MPEAPPLAGLRVLERASSLAATYAGFLLSEVGAEVVKVETAGLARPTPGDHVLARGKRSVALGASGWRELLGRVDAVLLDDSAPPPEPDPGLVHCHVSTWGRTGSRLPPDEALVAAATGVQALQWSWSRRPVWLVTPMIGYMTGILAALGVSAALFARHRGASGQAVEVSGVGAALALNSGTFVSGAGHRGSLSLGGDPRGVYPTYGFYPTADGWLFVGALTQAFWTKLLTALDRLDLLAHPRLQGDPMTFFEADVRGLVRAELEPIFATRSTAAWVEALRAADVPCGAVGTRPDFLRDPEARALGLSVPVEDPVLGTTWQPAAPAAFSDTPAPPPRAAVLPGADTAAVLAEAPGWSRRFGGTPGHGPRACLEGIRVLDLTSFIAGPFCPLLLAELGADVVKIESPAGDPFRFQLFGFVGWNRGKRSLVLDLKRAAGREVFLDLAREADVVVDNFRPGVMERLDIGGDRLAALNPRLVHTSITGYGSAGALAALPGFDPIFQARSGLAAAQGGDDAPVLHMIAYNDYCAGALGAFTTVAALVARERTGRGQRVDVSLFRTAFVDQAALMILFPGRPPDPRGGRDHLGPAASRRLYACRDGWLCVAAGSETEAAALGRLAGITLALDDPPGGAAAARVAQVLAAWSRAEAIARLADQGVPAAPALEVADIFTDAGLRGSGCLGALSHPALGPLQVVGPFVHLDATPATLGRPAPLLGADRASVLGELGYDAARIATLVEAGAVG